MTVRGASVREMREMAEALRAGDRLFSRFMQHLPGLAWIKDLEGRYVYANDAAVKAFRTPREELYGRTDEEVFAPEVAAQFQANDRQALAAAAGVQVIETLEDESGDRRDSLVSKFPIAGPDGTVSLIGGMAIDVTDRLRAEEALREADRRKDQFLATLAHELRNPLAPIRTGLHILREAGPDGPAGEPVLAILERQVGHLVRLVDDLLEISRISRGTIELRKERVELAAVVAAAVETNRPLLDERGHRLAVALPPEPVVLEADPVRLAQVFANLVNNAVKYTDPGGRIALSAERSGDEVAVRVRDDGIGVPAAVLSRIFDPFVQGDPSAFRHQGGLGIGLTLVKNLVELHGGSVAAASPGPGQGSEFTVRLPLAGPP